MSEKIKIGMIGCGKMAGNHLRAYTSFEDAEVIAVADLDHVKAEKAKKEFNVTKAYTDHRELLRDPAVDAVSICTHTAAHAQPTIDALNCAKPVLIRYRAK